MSNGFVFSTDAGSYDYDQRFNSIVTILERLVDSQQRIIDELREIRVAIQESGNIGPIEETRMW
jgi:hypothetical protein